LTPALLEERRLIHRNDSVRIHADAFRELRTRLLALNDDGGFVTLVAPIAHGCGGSYVARNLAAAFAFDESKSAILIDCNARHPCQHRALGVEAAHGLMDYLDDPEIGLEQIVYGTGIPRLHLVPIGPLREETAESFTSLRMRVMVDSLRSDERVSRHVILDGPAVTGSPDARILSDLADLVVLVAGYGMVTPETIEKAAAGFPQEKLAGLVFNNGP
jgi:Mrp family chromosome partitioning ATPase